jgi:HPt (histidine-containing phosphotransfer) domain-containing protein
MALEPTFSGDDLLATVGPHVDMLEELRDTFAEQYPEVLAAIRGAAAAQDARLLADKAHLMKNVAAMAGGPSSRQLSIAIEDAAQAGDYARAVQLAEVLAGELAALEQALAAFVATQCPGPDAG